MHKSKTRLLKFTDCYDVSFKLRGVEVVENESKASAAGNLKWIRKIILHSCWAKVFFAIESSIK